MQSIRFSRDASVHKIKALSRICKIQYILIKVIIKIYNILIKKLNMYFLHVKFASLNFKKLFKGNKRVDSSK